MALRVTLSLAVLFSSTARAADCEDPGEIVGEVEAAVLSTRFDLAREAADLLERAGRTEAAGRAARSDGAPSRGVASGPSGRRVACN